MYIYVYIYIYTKPTVLNQSCDYFGPLLHFGPGARVQKNQSLS